MNHYHRQHRPGFRDTFTPFTAVASGTEDFGDLAPGHGPWALSLKVLNLLQACPQPAHVVSRTPHTCMLPVQPNSTAPEWTLLTCSNSWPSLLGMWEDKFCCFRVFLSTCFPAPSFFCLLNLHLHHLCLTIAPGGPTGGMAGAGRAPQAEGEPGSHAGSLEAEVGATLCYLFSVIGARLCKCSRGVHCCRLRAPDLSPASSRFRASFQRRRP